MSFETYRGLYQAQISAIRGDGLYKDERVIRSAQGAEIAVEFPKGAQPRKVINLCANNYLGLSNHPEIVRAAHEGLDARGFGLSSVRFICGTQDKHLELEARLSEFLGTEDTILFGSCFDANAALFEAILTPEDAIFSDQLVHASLIDGIRLCKAQRHVFEHSNLEQLETLLKSHPARVRAIVTDGVFSMDGDLARLRELCDLADRYRALLIVDDSHATGFFGASGRGTHEHFGVMDRVDVITTTFGKALGGASGGCVSGKREIIQMLKQRGRPYLFSNALPPAVVYATLKALELVAGAPDRREHLWRLTARWRKALVEAGFDVKAGESPIVPIMLYDAQVAQAFSRELFDSGVFSVGFFYPVVAKGQARIRTQMSAALEDNHLEAALEVFVRVGKKLGVLKR